MAAYSSEETYEYAENPYDNIISYGTNNLSNESYGTKYHQKKPLGSDDNFSELLRKVGSVINIGESVSQDDEMNVTPQTPITRLTANTDREKIFEKVMIKYTTQCDSLRSKLKKKQEEKSKENNEQSCPDNMEVSSVWYFFLQLIIINLCFSELQS